MQSDTFVLARGLLDAFGPADRMNILSPFGPHSMTRKQLIYKY